MIGLEVCVDTYDGAVAAISGGADRIELCASLSEGGLTPSAGLMARASRLPVPCHAMIRPRSGLFHFSDIEAEIMLRDIAVAQQSGLAGVVLGAQASDDGLNMSLLADLTGAAKGLSITLHRVVDVVPDPLLAVRQAIDLGVDRVLTSGAQPFAPDGVPLIRRMVQVADRQLSIMPGCGLTPDNVAKVVRETGVAEVHAACRTATTDARSFSDFDPPGGRFETSRQEVSRMRAALDF